MRIRTFTITAVLFAAICLPARAEEDVIANINAAFLEERNAGTTPATTREMWTCAAFWYVWSVLVEHDFDEAMRATLDPALSASGAIAASAYWEKEATRDLGMAERDPEMEAYVDRQVNMAWGFSEGAVTGEEFTLVGVLGSCVMPEQ